MSREHKLKAVWMGDNFLPLIHFARMAESSFTSGRAYDLIVREEADSKAAIRSKEQNDKMWAMLTEISRQIVHGPDGYVCVSEKSWHGWEHYTPDEWKVLMMHAMGQDLKLLPALPEAKTGAGIVPYGGRSSHMTVGQMNELIEFIQYWGVQHGVRFATDKGITWNDAS